MHELTHIDLFSGLGGFALAARMAAGFRTVCFSEVDLYASAILRKHWPDVPNLGDIKRADFRPYAGATVLTGGFPCQPFSLAGKRRGTADDRNLWPAMLKVIARTKPDWIIGENVAGFVTMELDSVLASLEAKGYSTLPIVIPACGADAPHRRDRVWILANAARNRLERSKGKNGESVRRSLSESRVDAVRGGEASSNAESQRGGEAGEHRSEQSEERAIGSGEVILSHSENDRLRRREQFKKGSQGQGNVSNSNGKSARWVAESRGEHCVWKPESGILRVAHGIPCRLERIRALGNAIVPQVAQGIFEAIKAIEYGNPG